MRQRLFKAISCVALMVSVFFVFSVPSFADENIDGSDVLDGYVQIEGTSENPILYSIGESDYTGGTVFQVLSQRANVEFIYRTDTLNNSFGMQAFCELPVYLTVGFQVESGHTYSGAVSFSGSTNLTDISNPWSVKGFSFEGYDVITPENVDASIYPVILDSVGGSADYTINVNFNNWQSTYTGYVYLNFMLNFSLTMWNSEGSYYGTLVFPLLSASTHSTDWIGTLKDYATDAIVDSDGSLIKNQTIQQQQIANQQSQQSAQQHEDLKQGFTDNTYNNNVSNAGSQVDSYIDLEHNLLEQQNQQMSDYADTAFNLNTISPYINAIAMTSTFFTWIWNGYGEMSVVFVIVLAIGVACLILGIRRRG